MRADSVNRWLALGANFGVLIGIILLLAELDQNATMMRAQTRSEVTAELLDVTSGVWTDAEFADIHRRGNLGEELTELERYRFRFHYLGVIRYFENVHYQYRQGLYDEAEFAAQREAWKGVMSPKLVVEIWCGYGDSVSPEFKAEIESLLTTHTC